MMNAVDNHCDAIVSFDDDFAPLVRQAGIQLIR
jgi:hypothetical protein